MRKRSRLLFGSLCGSLLLAVTAMIGGAPAANAGPQATAHAQQAVPLTLMTFNIEHGEGHDGNVSLQRDAAVIRAAHPDIVSLQEVGVHWAVRSDFRDQAKVLANLLDMRVFFVPLYSFPADFDPEGDDGMPPPPGVDRREFGRAILSKHPIVSAHNRLLTSVVGRGPESEIGTVRKNPGLADVVINVRGVKVRVLDLHLQAGHDEQATQVRAQQVREILDLVDEAAPTIMMGDLNGDPDGGPVHRPELSPLFTNFVDAFAVKGEGPGYTFRSWRPDRRIDYILVSPDIDVRSAAVVHTLASDHFPVVADVTVEP